VRQRWKQGSLRTHALRSPDFILAAVVFVTYVSIMIKTVRKGAVASQDLFRRADLRAMKPTERFAALIRARNEFFPYTSFKRIASKRNLF
jgi:hypothetical protein